MDPDQIVHQKPADLDLQCFQKKDESGFSSARVKSVNIQDSF